MAIGGKSKKRKKEKGKKRRDVYFVDVGKLGIESKGKMVKHFGPSLYSGLPYLVQDVTV